ncbi:OsmC family protein [Pseudonocardia sp. TRM90224]|uniref:OsmC family protein n=1 Tax=Pseudonocardia sp. TRM90224 TaxID=2812678 RepID=UPI001E5779CE|nr:OsmC family protein [Pseudonocardia sp. TRM90224]
MTPVPPPADGVHRFAGSCSWTGSTVGEYSRTHSASAGDVELTLSAAPAFAGDPEHLDPEQLVVLAAASCQLLSFLAVAARARLDVRGYRDDATAAMPTEPTPMRLAEIVLRPRITLVGGPSEARVRHLVEVAHRECFIANSLATPVTVSPVIEFVPS